jgi:hypothetical protein
MVSFDFLMIKFLHEIFSYLSIGFYHVPNYKDSCILSDPKQLVFIFIFKLPLYTTFFLIIKRHFKTMDCPPLPLKLQEFEEGE